MKFLWIPIYPIISVIITLIWKEEISVDSDYFQIFPFITVYFRYKYIIIYNVLRISLQSE